MSLFSSTRSHATVRKFGVITTNESGNRLLELGVYFIARVGKTSTVSSLIILAAEVRFIGAVLPVNNILLVDGKKYYDMKYFASAGSLI